MTLTRATERSISTKCVLVLILAVMCGCGRSEPEFDSTPPWKSETADGASFHAELDGQTVTLLPVRATLSLPQEWVTKHLEGDENLHLSRRAIVLTAWRDGEFDKEYMSMCNALFPIDRCAFHAGDIGSTQAFQVRVYILDQSAADVESLITRKAAQEMRRIADYDPDMPSRVIDDWQQLVLSFGRFYVDFFATANIEFRFREFGSKTVVIVCMYEGDETPDEAIARMLASFAWPAEN